MSTTTSGSGLITCATVAMVRPLEAASNRTAATKAIRIERCQRPRFRRIAGVDPGFECLLAEQVGPSLEVGVVLTEQVQVFAELVEVLLTGVAIAATELADHQDHPTGSRQDGRHAREDGGEIHSLTAR
jgi:hypothetical protein